MLDDVFAETGNPSNKVAVDVVAVAELIGPIEIDAAVGLNAEPYSKAIEIIGIA